MAIDFDDVLNRAKKHSGKDVRKSLKLPSKLYSKVDKIIGDIPFNRFITDLLIEFVQSQEKKRGRKK